MKGSLTALVCIFVSILIGVIAFGRVDAEAGEKKISIEYTAGVDMPVVIKGEEAVIPEHLLAELESVKNKATKEEE